METGQRVLPDPVARIDLGGEAAVVDDIEASVRRIGEAVDRVPPVGVGADVVRDGVAEDDAVAAVRYEGVVAAVAHHHSLDERAARPIAAVVKVQPVAAHVASFGPHVTDRGVADRLRSADHGQHDVSSTGGGSFDAHVARKVEHLRAPAIARHGVGVGCRRRQAHSAAGHGGDGRA